MQSVCTALSIIRTMRLTYNDHLMIWTEIPMNKKLHHMLRWNTPVYNKITHQCKNILKEASH